VSGPNVDDPSVVVGVMMDVADVVMSCEGVADVVMNVDVDVVVEGVAVVVVAGQGLGAGQASVGQGQKGSHTSLKNCSIFTVKNANIPDKKYADPAKKTRFFLFFCYQEGMYLCVLQSNY